MEEIITKKNGTAKRYGARYGRTTRDKISKLEKDIHSRQKCPYCGKNRVKRVAMGIWNCKNCNAKFAGAAYSIKHESNSEASQ